MRKICVVTGTRAEYGLLHLLMKSIRSSPEMQLQTIVTGMHLSPEFGLTYKEVEQEFRIDKKIEMLLSSDTPVGVSKSMGLAQISFAEAFEELRPDMVVLLGDRFEIFSAASAATIARIPIAHIHGGETTEGAFDEAMRHAVSKMSHLHFVATEEYRQRVIQLGEAPERVFNFGAPGLDGIASFDLLTLEALEQSMDFRLGKRNLLVTFHPVTLEQNTAAGQFSELLQALDAQADTHLIFTKANADTDGRVINAMIDSYVAGNAHKSVCFASLGHLRYLSALQYVDAVVGNSSSGLIEAPTFRIGTINIGDRQKGRVKADSVIDCAPERGAISEALQELYSDVFQKKIHSVENPYWNGGATPRIAEVLRSFPTAGLLKKSFYDLPRMRHS